MSSFLTILILLVAAGFAAIKLTKSRQLQKEREARRIRRDTEARRRMGLE